MQSRKRLENVSNGLHKGLHNIFQYYGELSRQMVAWHVAFQRAFPDRHRAPPREHLWLPAHGTSSQLLQFLDYVVGVGIYIVNDCYFPPVW